jgi:hypothetical protein
VVAEKVSPRSTVAHGELRRWVQIFRVRGTFRHAFNAIDAALFEADDAICLRKVSIIVRNARLADAVRDARVAFDFLCATWPEVFLAQTHAVLAGLGIRVRPPEADLVPPLSDIEAQRHGVDESDRDKDGHIEGDHKDRDHHNGDDEGNDSDSEEGGDA